VVSSFQGSVSIKGGESLHQLINHQLHKKDSAVWSRSGGEINAT